MNFLANKVWSDSRVIRSLLEMSFDLVIFLVSRLGFSFVLCADLLALVSATALAKRAKRETRSIDRGPEIPAMLCVATNKTDACDNLIDFDEQQVVVSTRLASRMGLLNTKLDRFT